MSAPGTYRGAPGMHRNAAKAIVRLARHENRSAHISRLTRRPLRWAVRIYCPTEDQAYALAALLRERHPLRTALPQRPDAIGADWSVLVY